MVSWAHRSPHPKLHLERFNHFCTAHDHDWQTDRQTHATPSVTTGRTYVCRTAMRPNNPPPPHHTTTVSQPFFWDHLGELVPEENFWTSWCKGRLTEADTPTIRLGATPSGLTSAHRHDPPIFYRLDALPATQPTVSKHWRANNIILKSNAVHAVQYLTV